MTDPQLHSMCRTLRRARRRAPRRHLRRPFDSSRSSRRFLDRLAAQSWLAVDHHPSLPPAAHSDRAHADYWQCRDTARELHAWGLPHRPEDIATAVTLLRIAYYGRRVRTYATPASGAVSQAFDSVTAYDAAVGEWQAAGKMTEPPQFATF